MKTTELKKILETLDKKELMKLILEIAKLRKNNMDWLIARFQNSKCNKEIIEIYKKKIVRGFYVRPDAPHLNIPKAKRAISDFKIASKDKEGIIDLMIFYIQTGTEFVWKYEYEYKQLYTSMENMFDNVIKLLISSVDSAIIAKSMPRLQEIIQKAEGLGYGYQDSLKAMYEELKTANDNQKGDAAI